MTAINDLNRRQFLGGALGVAAGATALAACGSPDAPAPVPSGSASASAAPTASRIPISAESGKLSILEWAGYEAAGTKAQTAGLTEAGSAYTKEFGPDGLAYTYIENDEQALQKATSSADFDIMHPCGENVKDYVDRGLTQPWDLDLIPSAKYLAPGLMEQTTYNGAVYMLPWDWGYGSLTYRTDKIAAADATGWELAWNEKYAGHISLWSGAQTNFEIAAMKLGLPKPDDLTDAEIEMCKAELIKQKPLNKFYWDSEYGQMQPGIQSGTLWVAYSWQDTLVTMKAAKVPVAFMDPSQGRIAWFCGFMLGANTANYYHAHAYVESFLNKAACAQMTNAYAYGTANTQVTAADVTDKALAESLQISDLGALTSGKNHLQSYTANLDKITKAWQEVKAS